MAKKQEQDITALDLGLGEVTSSPKVEKISRAAEAAQKAAATAALQVAIEANTQITQREADKIYLKEKQHYMLGRAKSDDKVAFIGQRVFEPIFGKTYTFLYNTIPVTVRFDGSTQYFPRFIYNFLMEKITAVSESNIPTETNEILNS